MLFWLLGDFGYVQTPWWLLGLALVAIPVGLLAARPLDALARGELQARLLGVPVRGLRIAIDVVASVLTAAAVTTAGSIGFVGLVTPHLVRLLVGSSHRAVIPAAALAGGSLLVIADLAARTIVAPRMLPVGALTAMLGVPLFLWLMHRQRG
jgi:iron complex transport system permease protein